MQLIQKMINLSHPNLIKCHEMYVMNTSDFSTNFILKVENGPTDLET